jgi:predicted nucleic acid-binding protein
MTIIDANLLLYAYNADAPQQKASALWLQELLESGEIIGLPWVTMWAFIRISTNSRIWANPKSARDAFVITGEWLRQPGVVPLHPGPRHAEILDPLQPGSNHCLPSKRYTQAGPHPPPRECINWSALRSQEPRAISEAGWRRAFSVPATRSAASRDPRAS